MDVDDLEEGDEHYMDDDCEIRKKYDRFVLLRVLYVFYNYFIIDMIETIEMSREAEAVEIVEVVGDDGEAEVVHVVVAVPVVVAAAERGITRGANIPVDTETTITRMIITEIGVPRSMFRHI